MTRRSARWALPLLALSLASFTAPTVGATSPSAPDDTTAAASDFGADDPNAVQGPDPTGPQVLESWTLAPASSAEENGNRPNLSYTVEPGGEVKDKVTVYNLGNVPLIFHVYATDAFNGDDGTFSVLAGDKDPVDVGTWLRLDQNDISVPPGKQTTIPFVLKVPRDATPGDHVGAVLASSPTKGNGENGETITVDRRTGTRLFVRVAGDLRAEVGIADLAAEYHHSANSFSGATTVKFRVENRGNVRINGNPVVEVGGPFGMLSKTVRLPAISELLPGEHADLSVEVSGVPALFANAVDVSLEPQSDGVDGARGAAGTTLFAPPISVMLLLLVAVLVLLAMRARRRRFARRNIPAQRQLPPAAQKELQPQ